MSRPDALSPERIQQLLLPYEPAVSPALAIQLQTYLDLLLRWNDRTNLTAIRDPERIVERHFGEALFAARHLPIQAGSLLDVGSGAGFPGLPIALACPLLRVTLAESQGKKAAFLQEVIRQLAIPVEVWSRRVEAMSPARLFDLVALRAVDDRDTSLSAAEDRVQAGGWLVHLTSTVEPGEPVGSDLMIPNTLRGVVRFRQC